MLRVSDIVEDQKLCNSNAFKQLTPVLQDAVKQVYKTIEEDESINAENLPIKFEEALDNDSSSSSLPPGLSIKNDEDQQEFDLAVTYFEMNDKENAKSLLKNLIKKTQNFQIKEASIDLFEKLKKL